MLDIEYEIHRYTDKLAAGEDVQADLDTYQASYDSMKTNQAEAAKQAILDAQEALEVNAEAIADARRWEPIMEEEIRVLTTAKADF